MKFAHLADVHIGAWRHPKLSDLPDKLFDDAIKISIERAVDFILIAGDLFDSALPGIDHLRSAVRSLQRAKIAGIPVYCIPGSHDFSPSGKSMLRVLEEAGLLIDVFKGDVVDGKLRLKITTDPNTGAQITGVLGRKGSLEKHHYEDLDREWLESQTDEKSIFMFHTSITELKPKELSQMSSSPVSMLPKGFSYYAGGHVHITEDISLDGYAQVVYPGPVFPASFSELEKLGSGSFVLVDQDKIERVKLPSYEVQSVSVNMQGSPEEFTQHIINQFTQIQNKIILLRVSGRVTGGSIIDLDFARINQAAQQAYVLLRNTAGLQSEIGADAKSIQGSTSEIEEKVLTERAGGSHNPFDHKEILVMQQLLQTLSSEKVEGETNTSYDERVVSESMRVMGLDE